MEENLLKIITRLRESNSISSKAIVENYKCTHCNDTGFVQVDFNTFKPCKCKSLDKSKSSWIKGGFSDEMLQNKTFATYQAKSNEIEKMKNLASNYALNFEKNIGSIYLGGVPGCGKTHLGCAISKVVKDKGFNPMYLPYLEVFSDIKKEVNSPKYDILINKYSNAEVLFIDDLLKCSETEADKKILYMIINYRYINHLPTIFSSEKSILYLLKWDEAIGRRIYEMCKKGKFIKEILGSENNFSLM